MGVFSLNERTPGYYAVIPATVRYDDSIPANAKLLYGEISALIGQKGYCYATNQYFADVYQMAEDTISRLISKLEAAGYISREMERDSSGQIVRRRLYLDVSLTDGQMQGELDPASRLKNREGIGQKVGETNTSIIIPPIVPPEGGSPPRSRRKRGPQCKSSAEVLPERFDGFWEFYRTHMPPGSSAGNRQKAIRAWDKLVPSAELVSKMANALAAQVKSQTWLSGIGVPHASTWLNNRGWEDDWGAAGVQSADAVEDPGNEEGAVWVS